MLTTFLGLRVLCLVYLVGVGRVLGITDTLLG